MCVCVWGGGGECVCGGGGGGRSVCVCMWRGRSVCVCVCVKGERREIGCVAVC